jgi:hypothetical protein
MEGDDVREAKRLRTVLQAAAGEAPDVVPPQLATASSAQLVMPVAAELPARFPRARTSSLRQP